MTVTFTPRLGLPISSSESDPRQNTRPKFNELMSLLDDSVAIDAQGTYAARPSSAPRGSYYFASDVNTVYRSTGSGWVGVGTDASRLTGTAPVSTIPGLDAGKITSGVLGLDRVPSLPASRITTGVLSGDRVPSLDAGKITSGVLSPLRIPKNLSDLNLEGTTNVSSLYIGSGGALSPLGGTLTVMASSTAKVQAGSAVNLTTVSGGDLTLTGSTLVVPVVHSRTYSFAANVCVTEFGTLGRSVSARKYKTNITDAVIDPKALLRLQPRTWWDKAQIKRANEEGRGDPDARPIHIGLIAEEVLDAGLGELVTYSADGEIDGLQYDRFIAPTIVTLKWLNDQVDALTARVSELESATE